MKIIIKGTSEEIADLVLAVQSRQQTDFKNVIRSKSVFLEAASKILDEMNNTDQATSARQSVGKEYLKL